MINPATLEAVTPEVGSFIKPDGWAGGMRLETGSRPEDGDFILADGSRVRTSWAGCQFFLPSFRYTDVRHAVNIKVTSRTVRRDGPFRGQWVRVQIELVKEDEPNTTMSGWMLL